MATTPGSPVLQGLKNFWQRPEGTAGKVVLVLGAAAVAYGFVQILPFLIAAATDTLHLAALIGAILVFLFIVTDKRVRTLASLMFQSVMRYLTGLFIELDPIGILKSSPNQAVAQAFVAYVKSPAGQATLASFGFLPPS